MSERIIHFVPVNGPGDITVCNIRVGPGVMHTANPARNAVTCPRCWEIPAYWAASYAEAGHGG